MTALIAISGLMYSAAGALYYTYLSEAEFRYYLFVTSNSLNFVIVLIASCFLADSIRRIRGLLDQVNLLKQVNYKMMVLPRVEQQ